VDSRYFSATTTLTNLSTSHVVDTSNSRAAIPSTVLQSCLTVTGLGNMTILSNLIQQDVQAYVAFHWAELDPKVNASSRQFWIQIPSYSSGIYEDAFNYTGGLYKYDYWFFWNIPLTTSTTSTSSTPEFILYPTPQSIFGPSLNALELYAQTNKISLTSSKLDGKYPTSPKLI
jgi:hypothetical protein